MKNFSAKTHYFGAVATEYDVIREAKSERFIAETERVTEYLDTLPRGSIILDVPVGTGKFLGLYAARGFSAIGFDISPDMLRFAREKSSRLDLKIEFMEGDATNLTIADSSVDYIICNKFVKWLPDESKVAEFFKECGRVARCGALIEIKIEKNTKIFSKFPKLFGIFSKKSHAKKYGFDFIQKSLLASGFLIVKYLPLGIHGNSSYYFWLSKNKQGS